MRRQIDSRVEASDDSRRGVSLRVDAYENPVNLIHPRLFRAVPSAL